MFILTTILGILLIVLGICCALTPLATFVAAGHLIAIVVIVSGAAGIITAFCLKEYGWNLIVSILAIVLGILAIARPGGIKIIDNLLIYLLGIWLILRGGVSAYLSFKTQKLPTRNKWGLGLIVGILGIVLGVYALIHPLFSAITIGLLVALCFIEQGIDVITFSRMNRKLQK